MDIAAFALSVITNLISSAIEANISYSTLDFFQQRRIRRRIEDAIAEVVEPLLPFLENEGVSLEKQQILIQTCVDELRPLTTQSELLFHGSLNGQKIFEELYANGELPEQVIEEGVKEIYTLLCPRIATLLCKVPAAVKEWESQAWSENFRRLDYIARDMSLLFEALDNLVALPTQQTDETLKMARRMLAQKIRFDLDLTGLRADRPFEGKFDDFFIHPEIMEPSRSKNSPSRTINTGDESFGQFIQPGTLAVLVGPPGSGKSTWAKWLQRKALSNQWNGLCIRVELRRFASEQPMSPYELVRDAASKLIAEELSQDRIRQWIEAQKLIFVLDGFDEIPLNSRDKICEWIEELHVVTQRCPFVLTSRLLMTDHLEKLRQLWQYWEIQPFDEGRTIEYIERWYAYTPVLLDGNREVNATELAEGWGSDATIAPLTGNPLLLSTLLMVHHLDGRLPSGRSQLYRRYVDGMLGLWDDRRQIPASSNPLSLDHKKLILRSLALYMFLNELDQLEEATIEVWLGDYIEENKIYLSVDEILTILRERSGLIVGPGIYSFVHKSVAEYLVAETIHQGDHRDASGERIDRLHLLNRRDEDRWNTVTFLWAGLAPVVDVEEFIQACLASESWALAYGVLQDQYDRIQPESRKQLLMEGILRDHGLPFDRDYMSWRAPGPEREASFRVPSLTLRGLTPFQEFGKLVRQVIKDGTLLWADCEHSSGDMRFLLWISFIADPRDLTSWKTVLASPCNEYDLSPNSFFVISHWMFSDSFESPSLEEYAISYERTFPHFSGLLPIVLMSCVYIELELLFQQNRVLTSTVLKTLATLLRWDVNDIDSAWLLLTCEWNAVLHHKEYLHIDLLQSLAQQLEDILEQENSEVDVDILDRSRKFMFAAIELRDSSILAADSAR